MGNEISRQHNPKRETNVSSH